MTNNNNTFRQLFGIENQSAHIADVSATDHEYITFPALKRSRTQRYGLIGAPRTSDTHSISRSSPVPTIRKQIRVIASSFAQRFPKALYHHQPLSLIPIQGFRTASTDKALNARLAASAPGRMQHRLTVCFGFQLVIPSITFL